MPSADNSTTGATPGERFVAACGRTYLDVGLGDALDATLKDSHVALVHCGVGRGSQKHGVRGQRL